VGSYTWTQFLVCPDDHYALQPSQNAMTCPVCGRCYETLNGIAGMLPQYRDETRRQYLQNYEEIARDDLAKPLEGRREVRHASLLRFIGDTRGKRVLDVGSSDAGYLGGMEADLKVALDISLPYLEAIPPESDVMRVCADAEQLPVATGFFDLVIISGVLEHVISPEALVARLHQACRPDTRVIVVVPWEEDLSVYSDMPWKFTHLRSFTSYSFSQLWHQFRIVRRQPMWPRLADPWLFRLDERLPTPLFDFLRFGYFHRGLAAVEAERRNQWSQELPRRERRLLRYYRPTFYQMELRTFAGSWIPALYDRSARLAAALTRPLRRRR